MARFQASAKGLGSSLENQAMKQSVVYSSSAATAASEVAS